MTEGIGAFRGFMGGLDVLQLENQTRKCVQALTSSQIHRDRIRDVDTIGNMLIAAWDLSGVSLLEWRPLEADLCRFGIRPIFFVVPILPRVVERWFVAGDREPASLLPVRGD